MTEPLRLACIDSDAAPLFHLADAQGVRTGYEPEVGALLAAELGRPLRWVFLPWAEMIPAVQRGEADAVLCGQGVTEARAAQVDFTRPYAVFHESVLVRRGDPVRSPADLRGRRVAAIAGSTNMALAETFAGAVTVPFGGDSADVFGDMLAALRSGEVDAVVDDDVVFVPLGDHPDYELAFTVRTGNRWALGVAKDRPETRAELDAALGRVTADGRLAAAWAKWLPGLDYPFAEAAP
ncbi:polar amino acid transport system substrate-binding protein [Thermocatellispora tengchongensis]|uniref:Polar amino acid transport system substrate-binding protein n=1 Tax=Thermocatellispora tengchongensis TaxID=1073253 RepID=A0A840NXD6_9ACTN|nr:ABC transporter substrate-binding protein [Thermocatellispora tengchongensis]MBB5131872.1 polar amino acid transport system substrate-binding protein [Thermocatellispora tengchongensis]